MVTPAHGRAQTDTPRESARIRSERTSQSAAIAHEHAPRVWVRRGDLGDTSLEFGGPFNAKAGEVFLQLRERGGADDRGRGEGAALAKGDGQSSRREAVLLRKFSVRL